MNHEATLRHIEQTARLWQACLDDLVKYNRINCRSCGVYHEWRINSWINRDAEERGDLYSVYEAQAECRACGSKTEVKKSGGRFGAQYKAALAYMPKDNEPILMKAARAGLRTGTPFFHHDDPQQSFGKRT